MILQLVEIEIFNKLIPIYIVYKMKLKVLQLHHF